MTAARRLEKAAAVLLLVALGLPLVRTAAPALVVIPATGLAISNCGRYGLATALRLRRIRRLSSDVRPLRTRVAVPGHPLF